MNRNECFNTIDHLNDLITMAIAAINRYPYIRQTLMTINHFSNDLFEHSLNVGFLSLILGGNLYCNEKCQKLFVSAVLHDYGKCYIPKSILYKIGALTEEERITIETHPTVGHFHLSKFMDLPKEILDGILEHHEKIDGTGYNQKLKGTEISEFAKIIKIADVYDAMISDRIYRKGLNPAMVCEYLREQEGVHFDSKLVAEFIEMIKDVDVHQLSGIFRKRCNIVSSSKGRR